LHECATSQTASAAERLEEQFTFVARVSANDLINTGKPGHSQFQSKTSGTSDRSKVSHTCRMNGGEASMETIDELRFGCSLKWVTDCKAEVGNRDLATLGLDMALVR